MLTHNRSRSPIKKLFNRLYSLHTYVNYHKIHNMATCFGGVGDAPVEDPRTQEIDNRSESESQDEDLMRHVLAETANIKQFVEEKYREPREAFHEIEQRLNDLSLALHQQHTPIENILDRYTETLCMAQKKTSLENTLLQDIPILNGQDSSKLEDWLTDIETAAELTNESRTKLAQAKSWELVRTLIFEALIAQRSWEEIKDSLCLKISNADIHTSISQFMDIQQTDKESLATYVHRFKREANRCKFDNDATTIRIFLKGLKNVHTIVTKVYEKGPQTLAETIREVEKLQVAQQLTSSLLPASSVNTMSSDQEKCFQCQEVGHMAHYCPHIRCYDCNNYGHVAMDCPDKVLPSGTPACCRPGPSKRSRRSSSRYTSHSCHEHRRSRFSRSRSQPHNNSYRSNSHHNPQRSRSRSFHRSSCHHFSCDRSSSSHHCRHDTPHCRQSTSRHISWDDSRSHHRTQKQQYKPSQGSSWKSKDRKYKQVTINDSPSDHYSSDDSNRSSDDDLN